MATYKAQQKLIKLALKSRSFKLACELALRANIENNQSVYLPNAYSMVDSAITPNQWAGYLSALTAEGKYKNTSSDFGEVIFTNAS